LTLPFSTPLNTPGMSKSLPTNFGQMLAGLYQDQILNADKKSKAVKVSEGKSSSLRSLMLALTT
jgi:hypothetical protein